MRVALGKQGHHYRVVGPGASSLATHDDRLFPADKGVRAIARRLYQQVRDAPILSPHGHVPAALLADDEPFADPASLLVSTDHYLTRLLHADGVDLAQLGVGTPHLDERAARRVWSLLCERWHCTAGTAVRLWLQTTLAEVFGITERLSAKNADRTYDVIAERLAEHAYRPRALFQRFGIKVLATTDDPCDDLGAHARLAADRSFGGRVVPTFRPDPYLEVGRPGWPRDIARLAEAADVDTSEYGGFLAALQARRRYFIAHGATTADHSHLDVRTDPLEAHEAARIYRDAVAGEATTSAAVAFRRHMVHEMARMSCEDGLVMALHCGVRRNHHRPTAERFGPDSGHDIPVGLELTDALRPALERFGTHAGFHLVVFSVDETLWSRELAPLAGFYPCLYAGAPWWFLDAPDAIGRFYAAITETAGFSRLSGFVDDARSLCSIPARHDMARRIDASVLARLVAEHRLEEDEAASIALELVRARPAAVFKL
jgi:glucuronate isomerase